MTIRKLVTRLALYALCFAFGGMDASVDPAVDAALDAAVEAVTNLVRALGGGERLDLVVLRTWRDRFPFDCVCVSDHSPPVAATGAND